MTISRSALLTLLLAAAGLAALPRTEATTASVPHGGSFRACMDCHESMQPLLDSKVPHEPVSDGDCEMCHSPHAARFPHLLNMRERALCFVCHLDQKLAFQTGSVHTPIREGQCTACHQVHGSEHEALLTTTGNELCNGCHEEKQAQLALGTVHEPFAEGECLDCHAAHNSDNPNQLVAPAAALCTLCHDPGDEELVDAHYGIPIRGVRCTTCHEPHASRTKGLLRETVHAPVLDGSCEMCHMVESDTPQLVRATGGRLCAACHNDVPRADDTIVHAPVGEGNCGACHLPHAGDHDSLLVADTRTTCLQCHQDLADRAQRSKSAHPIREELGSCRGCHQVHSSTEENLLNAGEIRTCLGCHEMQRHGHPLGSDRLDPRTGQAITCVTCHDPHGTDYPYQLRADQSRGLCVECHNSENGGTGHGSGR